MTITTTDTALTARSASLVSLGSVAFGLATGLSAIAIFAIDRQQDQVDAFPALVAFFGILTALVFGLVVRGAIANGISSRRVLVLGIVALVGNAVFWAGIPAVFGVATLAVRRHAPIARATNVGAGLAVVALLANLVAAVVG